MIQKELDQWLQQSLTLDRPIEVVDIGASPIGVKPPYQHLLTTGLARVTGFEPNPEQFKKLKQQRSAHARYFPYAVGDGSRQDLYITHHRGFVSTFKPDDSFQRHIENFFDATRIVDTLPVETVRLDDISSIDHIDLLKIDIQGGELVAFQNGRQKLAHTMFIHTEVAFVRLYHGQPGFSDQELLLNEMGLLFHGFYSTNKYPLQTTGYPSSKQLRQRDPGQVVDADAIFFRDFRCLETLDSQQLMRAALIAHFVYNAAGIVGRILQILGSRGEVPRSADQDYLGALS